MKAVGLRSDCVFGAMRSFAMGWREPQGAFPANLSPTGPYNLAQFCAAHTVDYCGSSQIGQHWLARMGNQMRTVSAKDAKYNFGELIDKARAAPVTVAKYGRPVVVVMAVEEYERLKGLAREGKSASKVARSTRLLAIRSRRK